MYLYINKIRNRIFKLFYPIQGEIWCLHRVLPQRSLFPGNRELEITPEYFEELIVKSKNLGFEFCSIDEIYKSKLPCFRFAFKKKFVNISFDDGFHDIFHYAYPILKKHNIPFTIYLTTNFPDKKALIWWVLLERIIMDYDEITLGNGEKFICNGLKEKIALYEIIANRIFTSEINSLELFKNLFINYLNDYAVWFDSLTLNWDQIAEMCEEGLCTIGSHSVTHPNMIKISDADLKFELEESIKIVKNKIRKDVFHFSYPHSFWSPEVEEAVKQTGFKTAVMGYGGSIRWRDNKYKLPRKYIVQP
jgi:peptidoglycan/xylan/chitin deacetylase (PgdA/CDA1 family)